MDALPGVSRGAHALVNQAIGDLLRAKSLTMGTPLQTDDTLQAIYMAIQSCFSGDRGAEILAVTLMSSTGNVGEEALRVIDAFSS